MFAAALFEPIRLSTSAIAGEVLKSQPVVIGAAWWESLIGVLIGAAVALSTTFGLEWWRNRRLVQEAADEQSRAIRQAIRLVLAELDEIDSVIREAASVGAYWTERMAGRELPTGTWNTYRDTLAVHLDPHPWRLVAGAFAVANDLNWRLRAGKLARPPESKVLLAAWRSVRAAMVVLEPLMGQEQGAFGYSGYADEEDLERDIFGPRPRDAPEPEPEPEP